MARQVPLVVLVCKLCGSEFRTRMGTTERYGDTTYVYPDMNVYLRVPGLGFTHQYDPCCFDCVQTIVGAVGIACGQRVNHLQTDGGAGTHPTEASSGDKS